MDLILLISILSFVLFLCITVLYQQKRELDGLRQEHQNILESRNFDLWRKRLKDEGMILRVGGLGTMKESDPDSRSNGD